MFKKEVKVRREVNLKKKGKEMVSKINKKTIIATMVTALLLIGIIAPVSYGDVVSGDNDVQMEGTKEWSYQVGDMSGGWVSSSSTPPIVVGDYIYVGQGDALLKINSSTGELVAESESIVYNEISYNNYYTQIAPAASNDGSTIYLTVTSAFGTGGAGIAAFNADTLELKWVTTFGTDASAGASPITVDEEGNIYSGTYNSSWDEYWVESIVDGTYYSLDSDGKINWSVTFSDDGATPDKDTFYNAGALIIGDYVYFGGDAGNIYKANKDSGSIEETLLLASNVRSTPVTDGDYIYVTTVDGVLHKLNTDFEEVSSIDLGYSSSSTPVLYNGVAYVGVNNGFGAEGTVAAIDTDTMEVIWTVNVDGAQQGDMLLWENANGNNILYAVINDYQGGLYAIELGEDGEVVSSGYAFLPESDEQNYSTSTVILNNGSLIYKNDLALFSIGEYVEEVVTDTTDTTDTSTEDADENETVSVPETADNSNVMLMAVLMVAVSIGATFVVRRREY